MVDNLYLWYCVESVIVFHEGTAALAEVTDLDVDISQELTAFPLSHNHDYFRVHFGQIEFHELVPAQDIRFFYTHSCLSALQSCALIFPTNFQFIFTFK